MDWSNFFSVENFNTDKYTVTQLVLCATGGAMWAILYIKMLLNIRKHHYVEMPYFVAAGNLAWEFLWAWVFAKYIDLGDVYVFLYRAWFFVDLFIFGHVVSYGQKQISNPYIRKHYKPILFAILAMFLGLIYSFVRSSFDFPLGVNSAYMLNLLISIMYLQLYMRQYQSGTFLKLVAWFKMIGTGLITIAFWNMIPPDNYFEHVAGPIVFVIDIYYIWMIYNWNKPQLDPEFNSMDDGIIEI